MDTFLTWEYVATFAGLVFATNLFVNFTKELPYVKDMPTKYYTSIVAFVLIIMSNLSSGVFDYKNIPLMILNSVIITFTATGGYDFTNKTIKSDSQVEIPKEDSTSAITNDFKVTVDGSKVASGINILPTINDTESK